LTILVINTLIRYQLFLQKSIFKWLVLNLARTCEMVFKQGITNDITQQYSTWHQCGCWFTQGLVHPGPFKQARGETLGIAVEGAGLPKATLWYFRHMKSLLSVMQGKVEKQCWVRSPGTAALFIATDAQMPAMWPNADLLTLLLFLPSSYWSPSHSLTVVFFLFTLQSESTIPPRHRNLIIKCHTKCHT
jgi:hypothetical protein